MAATLRVWIAEGEVAGKQGPNSSLVELRSSSQAACSGFPPTTCGKLRRPFADVTSKPIEYRIYNLKMVPRRGLEPPRLAALVPETSASTNSAIWAEAARHKLRPARCQREPRPRRGRVSLHWRPAAGKATIPSEFAGMGTTHGQS